MTGAAAPLEIVRRQSSPSPRTGRIITAAVNPCANAFIPRQNTKPLAKALIARFGSLAGVRGAEPQRIAEVEGAGPSGDPKPSAQGIAVTRESIKALETIHVRAHDRLVVGRDGVASFKN